MDPIEITPEQQETINYLRIILGDIPISAFYPILTDEEYYKVLERNNWNVKKAARQLAFSILFYLTQVNYRERAGDIEVWNNASIEYRKALQSFLDDDRNQIPTDLVPWVAGASWEDICKRINNRDWARSPLAQISLCTDWYTRVPNYETICERGCGCG